MKPSERLIHRLVTEGVIIGDALTVRSADVGGISITRDSDNAAVAASPHGVLTLLAAKTLRTSVVNGIVVIDI